MGMRHDYVSRENYGKVVQMQYNYLVNGVAADLHRIAIRAYAENLITKPTFQNVTNPVTNETDRATRLVSAIQTSIGIRHEAFDVFLKILREEPVVSKLADTLEKALIDLEKHIAQKLPSHGGGAGGHMGLFVLLGVSSLLIAVYEGGHMGFFVLLGVFFFFIAVYARFS